MRYIILFYNIKTMAATISAGKNVKFYLSKSVTSYISHGDNCYKQIDCQFGEDFHGIVYVPDNLIDVINYKNEKTELFLKNIDTILNLDLEKINYEKLFDEFLNYIDKNFKIAITKRFIHSLGENYETRELHYNFYYNTLSLKEKNNIDLFNN